MDPIAIAMECLGKAREAITSAEKIKSGLTNESWLVRADDIAVVVRSSNRESDALQINRESECRVLSIVAEAGIGAPVLNCAPDRHFLVTFYVPGRTWSTRDVRVSANIQRIATVLRSLHALPVPEGVQTVELMQIVCSYWNTLMACGRSASAGTSEIRERARQLIGQLADDAKSCLCHNDVHHLNVVDGGHITLIDWEYAGIGDPYFDLASVCCYHAFSDASRKELMRAYLGHDSTSATERLHRMCWVFNYIRDLWFAVREMQ
jgi:thiamine kinase